MNISTFDTVKVCEQGAWVTIKDFDEMDTDFRIKVVGIDSKKFKSQVNRISKMTEGKKAQDMERLEESTIRTLVAISLDWDGAEDPEGNAIEFSSSAMEEVYTNSPWVSEQVIAFAKERKNFLAKK